MNVKIKPAKVFSKQSLATEIRNDLTILFFLALYSVTLVGFVINSEIVSGGLNGIGTLVYYASGKMIPVGYTSLALNAILIVIALKILGKGFGVKTISAIVAISVFINIAQSYITEPFLGDDKAMSAVIGGILIGLCIGSIFKAGGSTGGTDILALIINKYRDITPGKVILYADVVIISSAFVVFYLFMGKPAMEAFRIVVYGFVVMAITAYTIDLVLLGSQQSVQMFIFSTQHEIIAEDIASNHHRGVTVIHGKGWYSKKDTEILMVVVLKNEIQDILRVVKAHDPEAFTSIGTVTGVYGKGFSQIKGK
ncbi:membrane protein [Bacteroidia bacterium]|nr:membrane protein [Bacteroidia bacterium]